MSSIAPQLRTNIELLQQEFETVTHNLANASTAGFKRRSNAFIAALQAQTASPQIPGNAPANLMQLTQQTDFSQGKLVQTSRSLDLALGGPGFFVVETPQGPLYTRNGAFNLDANGQIVDSEGHSLAGNNGPLTLPPSVDLNQIQIGTDSTIKADEQAIGKIRVVDFPGTQHNLIAMGHSSFQAPEGTVPHPAEGTAIRQGYQESSNVNTMKEMVDMMSVSRMYEANMKFISAQREASQAMMQVAMG